MGVGTLSKTTFSDVHSHFFFFGKDGPVDGMIWLTRVISRNSKAVVSHKLANEHFKPTTKSEHLIKTQKTLARNLVKTTFAR